VPAGLGCSVKKKLHLQWYKRIKCRYILNIVPKIFVNLKSKQRQGIAETVHNVALNLQVSYAID
jgi:hypothetical protein